MGKKRERSLKRSQARKRPCPSKSTSRKESDLNYISKYDYVIIGDLMYVRPYVFEFKANFKQRWKHKTIFEVFCQEFKHAESDYWAKEFKEGRILCNGARVGENVIWDDGLEVVHIVHRHESAVLSQKIEIAHNHEHFLVVSKPPSIPIHPCGTYRRNSLQFILKSFYNSGHLYAVHRLDKETSGLVIFAKTPEYASRFSCEIKEHKVRKTYLAGVRGIFPKHITECSEPLYWHKREMKAFIRSDGVEAKTLFKTLSSNISEGTSVVECKPVTGRTHQIRVHLAHLGYPIVNDHLYGSSSSTDSNSAISSHQNTSSVTLLDSEFKEQSDEIERSQTYRACEWSRETYAKKGRHLTHIEEGHALSCSNCPQVTNVKNVEVQAMYIHLHALKYESEEWSFEVPLPKWMKQEKESDKEDERSGNTKSCIVT